ncbi:MAG: hypothetical protein JWN48_3196 [Myxococcaceae bacterium]|nr:hypothetical protein [Myxococcaceae bacterium]
MLGHGIGLRAEHYPEIVGPLRRGEPLASDDPSALSWFEVITENFLEPGGNPRRVLCTVREHFPVVMHGVSLSLGSVDPLNARYLDQLSALMHELEPAWVSDHLCWGSVDGSYAHDLLPLPFTDEALVHVAERVERVQERLRRALVIENVSSYLQFAHSTMPEWEFLSALVARTGCELLLDVNNVFVSAHNHGFDAREFIRGLPRHAVRQLHLAGHSEHGALKLDTHAGPVCDEVLDLYAFTLQTHGQVATCIEWDEQLPSFARLLAESARAATRARQSAHGGPLRAGHV